MEDIIVLKVAISPLNFPQNGGFISHFLYFLDEIYLTDKVSGDADLARSCLLKENTLITADILYTPVFCF